MKKKKKRIVPPPKILVSLSLRIPRETESGLTTGIWVKGAVGVVSDYSNELDNHHKLPVTTWNQYNYFYPVF